MADIDIRFPLHDQTLSVKYYLLVVVQSKQGVVVAKAMLF